MTQKQTRILMGMPITVQVTGRSAGPGVSEIKKDINAVFDYFRYIDETFSTYKDTSEIMKINRGELAVQDASKDVQEILVLAEKTKQETDGYFDVINRKGIIDPSGIVKGWAIRNVAGLLNQAGYQNYYVDAGGDIQVSGSNEHGQPWSVGIKNPFNQTEIVKIIYPGMNGVATSGTYIRGQHIYNPKRKKDEILDIVSLTIIGPDVYEADRFATAAFAMGRNGIEFIESLVGFEGYMINCDGIATMTSNFEKFTIAGIRLAEGFSPTAKQEGETSEAKRMPSEEP